MWPQLALFFLALCRGLDAGCPREDPAPCHCAEGNGGDVFFDCSRLKNRQELTGAFRKVAGIGPIAELLIRNSNISHIPRDLFSDSPVSRIRIKDSLMMYLFDRELERAAGAVSEIALDGVEFEGGLDWNVLDNLSALRILVVSRSGLESVPYGASELELPALETLVLEDNQLVQLHPFAFQNFKELRNLKLNKNFLTKYDRSMLPLPECKLQFMDLSHNKLASLPRDAFDGMEELHSLLLRGNKFQVLEKSYMQTVYRSLFYLDVANNPLVCGCEMTWLVKSDSKPYHVFGECTTLQDPEKRRNLKEVKSEDFTPCSVAGE